MPPRITSFTRAGSRLRATACVSGAGVEPALPRISAWCLLPLGYEDAEPPAGTDPASLALRRRRSAIELRGLELPIVESNHEPPGSEPDAAAS